MIIPDGYAKEHDCACGLNGVDNDLVADYLLGLNIKEACCIHDWMYGKGKTEKDRIHADKVFLKNMLTLIDSDTNASAAKRSARKALAYKYYLGVLLFGYPIFHRRRLS